MEDLANRETPAEGVLSEAEIDSYLGELDADEWTLTDENHLEGTFSVDDFAQALSFATDIGEIADDRWHHPDLHIVWGEVTVELWSHEVDALQEIDFVVAAEIQQVYESTYDPTA